MCVCQWERPLNHIFHFCCSWMFVFYYSVPLNLTSQMDWIARHGGNWVWFQNLGSWIRKIVDLKPASVHRGTLQTESSFFGKAKVLLCIETSWPFPTWREPSFALSAQGFAATYATCTLPARPPWLRSFSHHTLSSHPLFVLPLSLPSVP